MDNIELTILNIEFHTVGKEWNYQNINNPYSRIYYITSGKGRIEYNNEVIELKPKHLYLIPCFTTANLCCDDRFTHYYIHFTSRIQRDLDILSVLKCRPQVQAGKHDIDESIFKRLLKLNPNRALIEYDAKKPIYHKVLQRANELEKESSPANMLETNALLRLLMSVFIKDYGHQQTDNIIYGLSRFQLSIDYIHDNIDKQITIEQLAEIEGLTSNYYSNLFSKVMGVSPIQYINKRRIEDSQNLLICTHDNLFNISRKVGFMDEYYFSRVFKKTVGISPDNYRKQSTPHP